MSRKLFCEISPRCYEISLIKENTKRNIRDFFSRETFAQQRNTKELPVIVKSHFSPIIRRLEGVDLQLQENKRTNLRLAAQRLNGIIVKPGETFSFWKIVGKPSAKKGYKEGLLISKTNLLAGSGGGLCQMANMIHYLVLNSPLQVTELHHHTDALFPDERRRVPFGTGTSIMFNHVDYRFKNTSDRDIQILVWCDEENLNGEMRTTEKFPDRYKLVEENHHFEKEGDRFYRISQVYRMVYDRESGKEKGKELILDNHSLVMYDHSLIPTEQIRQS